METEQLSDTFSGFLGDTLYLEAPHLRTKLFRWNIVRHLLRTNKTFFAQLERKNYT